MAKQVKRSELSEEDIFRNIRESAKKTITVVTKINEEFKLTATTLKQAIGGAKFDNTKNLDSFNKLIKASNKLMLDAQKNEQALQKARELRARADAQLERLATEKAKREQQQIRTADTLAASEEKKAKAAAKVAKATKDEASAYKQLEKNTRELKNQSKEYAAQLRALDAAGKKHTAEWREVSLKYKDATRAAIEGDKALKRIDQTVGDNFRNVGNYTGAVDKLSRGLGALGLAFGVGSIVRGAGETIVEFDQKIADLVAITGAGGKDLEFFKSQAIELGKGVQGGAGEVIEAYKLIGSAKPELLANAAALDAVTQSAITLSQASGMTLPEAATALTDAMNQFGAPAEKAGQFIDALANGALFGSAEIPQVTEALLKFGAVANTSNVSLEESVGLIEALAEKGLKGAEAGTSLRNVMLKLSAPDALPTEAKKMLDDLGVSFADLQDTSKPFSERLEALKPLLTNNTALVKVFGTENAVAATNLLNNTDRIKELTASMATQGTASKQAEDRTKTLSFVLNQLKESWNALILQFSKGEGFSKVIIEALSFIAENLTTIVSIALKAGAAWAIYRGGLIAVNAAQFIMKGGLKETVKSLVSVFTATKKAGEGAVTMGDNIGKAGKTMGAIPWVAIIGAVIQLAVAFYDVASGAKAAREASASAAKTIEDAEKKASTRSEERQNNLRKEFAAMVRLKNEAKDQQKAEAEFLVNREKLLAKTRASIDADIKAVRERKNEYLSQYKSIDSALATSVNGQISSISMVGEKLEENFKKMGINTDELKNMFGNFDTNLVRAELIRLQGRIDATSEKIIIYKKELESTDEALKDATSELVVNSNAQEDNTGKINAKIPKMKALNVEMDKYNEYLTKQTDLLNKLAIIEKQRASEAIQQEIDLQLSEDVLRASETGIVDTEKVEELVAKKYQIEREGIELNAQFQREQLEQTYQMEAVLARQKVDENYQKLISQEGLTAEEKQKINADYQVQLQLLELDQLQRAADLELELRLLKEATTDELIALEKEKNQQINELNDKLIEAQIEHAEKEKAAKEKAAEGVKKDFKTQQELVKLSADFFIEQSERKIRQIEKEISAAEKQFDLYKGLAESGNINARESLAEQQRLINEANRKKEQEQKRIERIKLAEVAYSSYISNVEKNDANPLASTLRDLTLLRQFVSALPGFYEGTDTTVSDALGAPFMGGKDGYVVRVDGSEKILNPSHSRMTGNMTTSEIAQVSQEYLAGNLIRSGEGAYQLGGAWQSSAIIKELADLKAVIKAKPETNIELGEIISGAMEIVKTTRKGNDVIYNRYRVK